MRSCLRVVLFKQPGVLILSFFFSHALSTASSESGRWRTQEVPRHVIYSLHRLFEETEKSWRPTVESRLTFCIKEHLSVDTLFLVMTITYIMLSLERHLMTAVITHYLMLLTLHLSFRINLQLHFNVGRRKETWFTCRPFISTHFEDTLDYVRHSFLFSLICNADFIHSWPQTICKETIDHGTWQLQIILFQPLLVLQRRAFNVNHWLDYALVKLITSMPSLPSRVIQIERL